MRVPGTHYVNGTPLVPPFPEGLEVAMFGMGCFWGAERVFWETPGVFSTAVGYAPRRGRARRLRPRARELRDASADLLGEP